MSSDAARRFRVAVAVVSISEAALAALLIVVVTGIALVIVYDPADPLTSVALMRLANPAAAFVRNLHYWSTQALLVLSVIHVWQHMARASDQRMRVGPRAPVGRACLGVLAWSGSCSRGDVEAQQALRVVHAAVEHPMDGRVARHRPSAMPTMCCWYCTMRRRSRCSSWWVTNTAGSWSRPVMVAPCCPCRSWLVVAVAADGPMPSSRVRGSCSACRKRSLVSSPGLVLIVSAILAVLAALRWSGLRRGAPCRPVTVATVYAALTVIGWGFRDGTGSGRRSGGAAVTGHVGWVVHPGSPALATGIAGDGAPGRVPGVPPRRDGLVVITRSGSHRVRVVSRRQHVLARRLDGACRHARGAGQPG
jgi:hypothetical protein